MTTTASPITWAEEHPEVAANNARPAIPWPCEKIQTDLGHCHQPSIVTDSSGELYAEGVEGNIFHSFNRGRKWSRLCRVPPLFDVPRQLEGGLRVAATVQQLHRLPVERHSVPGYAALIRHVTILIHELKIANGSRAVLGCGVSCPPFSDAIEQSGARSRIR